MASIMAYVKEYHNLQRTINQFNPNQPNGLDIMMYLVNTLLEIENTIKKLEKGCK